MTFLENSLVSVQMLLPFHHHDPHSCRKLVPDSTYLNFHTRCLEPRHLQDNLANQTSFDLPLEVAVQLLDP